MIGGYEKSQAKSLRYSESHWDYALAIPEFFRRSRQNLTVDSNLHIRNTPHSLFLKWLKVVFLFLLKN